MRDLIHRQVGRDGYYHIWHKSEKNMFIFIHSGSGSIVTRDASYPMNDGTLCFIGKDKYHYTFPDSTENYIRSKFFISSEDLLGLLKALNRTPHICERFSGDQITIGSLDARNSPIAEQIFNRLDQLSPESDYYQAELYSALLQLIILLGENNQAPVENTPGAIQTAVDYINEHVTEDIGIESICSKIYMSKYHFCREFKKKIGMTVMEYILKTRITMAKELLCEGSMSVTDISEACGFSSISYFSRAFKNETGVTPLQYKKSKIE